MLSILPVNIQKNNYNPQNVSFWGGFRNPIKPKKGIPTTILTGIKEELADFINKDAYKRGISTNDYLEKLIKYRPHMSKVGVVESKSAIVGNTKIHSLIDGEQIFNKTLQYIDYADKSIQVEMFEFQNLTVDGLKWIQNGAEKVPGAKQQQQILFKLLKKKQAKPDMKIQIILDAHKWYIDGLGRKVRHYGNQDMIRYLKQNGIDVVPYPKASQGGSALQHIKLLVVDGKDGKKAILGGMNWGSHSAANHDACVALETLPKKKNSEIDNILEHHFNADWALSWKKIGETKLVSGPINKEEQKFYHGIHKEIKQENVDYVKLVEEFYGMPEAKNRFKEGKLDLIPTNPLKKSSIKVLGTKPRELSEVGKEGDESTREFLLNKIKTCKKIRAQLFVLTDKEIIQTVIKRVKSGELDAKFVISSDILKFPYCRMPYHHLQENNIPVRVYKTDKSISQRLHSKWAVFDDKEVLIGSTNWSAMGLNQNLKKGFRNDYELHTKTIKKEIKEYADDVKEFEKELGIPSIKDLMNYNKLLKRRSIFRKAINNLEKSQEANMVIDGKEFSFTTEDGSTLNTIMGYYSLIKKRLNAKEKYKRGNNEMSIVFESPSLAKNVFDKQFEMDWKHSESEYDELKHKVWPIKKPNNTKNLDMVG